MKEIIKKIIFLLLDLIRPKIDQNNENIKHYGTFYGGYDIVENENISNVISCGLGEDASFDLEIIDSKNCNVIAVDPTDRAKIHYKEIIKNLGKIKNKEYSSTGFQSIDSYNLQKVNTNNFKYVDRAVYDKSMNEIKLFLPENIDHVSASINKSKKYSENFFLTKCITIKEILLNQRILQIDILKLDIEGAEIVVIKDIIREKIFPKQIIVEFTDIRSLNIFKHIKILFVHLSLKKNNYRLVYINKKGDFTYLRKK